MSESVCDRPCRRPARGTDIAPERIAVESLLDHHRATLLWKCGGLTGVQLAARTVPTSTDCRCSVWCGTCPTWSGSRFRRRIAGEDIPADLLRATPARTATSTIFDPAVPRPTSRPYAAEVEAARTVLAVRDYDDTFVARYGDGSRRPSTSDSGGT